MLCRILEEIPMTHNIYRDGVVHVMSEECSSCIFRPHDRPVAGARVAEMVRETLAEDGATIVCHSTLYDLDGNADQAHAICRGGYDRLSDRDPILRLAAAMGRIEEQSL